MIVVLRRSDTVVPVNTTKHSSSSCQGSTLQEWRGAAAAGCSHGNTSDSDAAGMFQVEGCNRLKCHKVWYFSSVWIHFYSRLSTSFCILINRHIFCILMVMCFYPAFLEAMYSFSSSFLCFGNWDTSLNIVNNKYQCLPTVVLKLRYLNDSHGWHSSSFCDVCFFSPPGLFPISPDLCWL